MFVKAKNSGPLVRVKGEGSETVDSFGTDEAIHRRAERRDVALDEAACGAAAPPEGESPLLSAVQALPETYSSVIHLYYYEGYSIKEIAKLLGLPAPTVGTRLARGRERLRQLLKEED